MPLGESKFCDCCSTLFWSDPVDQNDTCMDCINDKPIPRCEDCDGLLKRDIRGGVCEDCENRRLNLFTLRGNLMRAHQEVIKLEKKMEAARIRLEKCSLELASFKGNQTK